MVVAFLLLLLMALVNGLTAQSSENEVQVSGIHPIEENVNKDDIAKPFYMQIQVDMDMDIQCPVYLCYLSQLDKNYVSSDKSRQIRAGISFQNRQNSEIIKQCNLPNHKDVIQPKAWHGLKVEIVSEKNTEQVFHIQTSFSEEQIYLKLANADESAIQIHFGTPDKPLFTQYMDSKAA